MISRNTPPRLFTVFFVTLMLLAGCAATDAADTGAVASGAAPAEVTIALGETGRAGELQIRFVRVVSDSRCPADVSCVWEGNAELLFALASASGAEREVTLNTSTRYATEATYGEYTLALVGVEPQRDSEREAPRDSYRATLRVSRAATR